MKKIFTFCAAVLMAVSMFGQGFGILVNGKMYYAGQENKSPLDPSFREFMVLGLSLKSGDFCQLCDAGSNYATWAVNLDGASVQSITRDGDKYKISADGCYNFYIKIKDQQDQLYVETGECGSPAGTDISGQGGQGGQGGDQGGQGGQGGGGNAGAHAYWYWKGYVDGKDIESEIDGGLFDGGMSEITVKDKGYIFVVYQVQGVPGQQYMAAAYSEDTHCTMSTSGAEKLMIPAGNHTLYLYDNGDGTVELSREQLQGKKLMDTDKQAIENTTVTEQAQKVLIDGVLYIRVGEKLYDIQGQPVNK